MLSLLLVVLHHTYDMINSLSSISFKRVSSLLVGVVSESFSQRFAQNRLCRDPLIRAVVITSSRVRFFAFGVGGLNQWHYL